MEDLASGIWELETAYTAQARTRATEIARWEGTMTRRLTAMMVIAGLALIAGCGQQVEEQAEDPAKVAYREFRDAYLDAETKNEQVALVVKSLLAAGRARSFDPMDRIP
jgi:hypothetical protein